MSNLSGSKTMETLKKMQIERVEKETEIENKQGDTMRELDSIERRLLGIDRESLVLGMSVGVQGERIRRIVVEEEEARKRENEDEM